MYMKLVNLSCFYIYFKSINHDPELATQTDFPPIPKHILDFDLSFFL